MDEEQKDKSKKAKYLSPHDKVRKVEECIYRMVNSNRFLVVVQKRINGKVRTKKKRQVKLIQEARQLRKKFTYELEQEDMRHRDGQLKWEAAYGRYIKHIEQKIEDSKNSYKPLGQGSLETAKAAYKYTRHWEKLFLSQISSFPAGRQPGTLSAGDPVWLSSNKNGFYKICLKVQQDMIACPTH